MHAGGEIADTDADRVSTAVLAMLQGFAVLVTHRDERRQLVDTLVSNTIEVLVHGLRPATIPRHDAQTDDASDRADRTTDRHIAFVA